MSGPTPRAPPVAIKGDSDTDYGRVRIVMEWINSSELGIQNIALVVDLAGLEHNLETVHGFFRRQASRLRPQEHQAHQGDETGCKADPT